MIAARHRDAPISGNSGPGITGTRGLPPTLKTDVIAKAIANDTASAIASHPVTTTVTTRVIADGIRAAGGQAWLCRPGRDTLLSRRPGWRRHPPDDRAVTDHGRSGRGDVLAAAPPTPAGGPTAAGLPSGAGEGAVRPAVLRGRP